MRKSKLSPELHQSKLQSSGSVCPSFVRLVLSVQSVLGQAGSPRTVLASLADLCCGFALAGMPREGADVECGKGEGAAGISTVFPYCTSRDA